jgi:hypothetical protein
MKKTVRKVLTEMISVILGILIALLIGNWKDKKDDKRFVKKILNSVSLELSDNKAELEKIIMEHKLFVDTLNIYIKSKDMPLGTLLSKSSGFRMVNISNTSWKTFLNANMELVDYEHISLLTGIDESKQNLRDQVDKLADLIYSNLMSKDPSKKIILMLMINDLISIENNLLEMHDKYLSLADSNTKD